MKLSQELLTELTDATCKLELMQSLLNVLTNYAEEEKEDFAVRQDIIRDLMYILVEGIDDAVKALNNVQGGGVAV